LQRVVRKSVLALVIAFGKPNDCSGAMGWSGVVGVAGRESCGAAAGVALLRAGPGAGW